MFPNITAKIHEGIQLCEAKIPDCGLLGDSEVQASQYDFNTDLYKTGATDCCKTESASSEVSLIEDLKAWAVSFQIRHNALDSLLKVLKSHGHQVPSSSRTLLDTVRRVEIEEKSQMNYKYFGLRNILIYVFSMYLMICQRQNFKFL